MNEAATQPNQNSEVLNQAGVMNRVKPKKSVSMRAWETTEYEKELETSRLNAENAAKGIFPVQPSEQTVNTENPTPPDTTQSSDWQKRYADLQSDRDKKLAESKKKENELLQENNELKNKITQAATNKPKYPTSEQELEQWCKEFPPLLPIIQTIALKAFEGEKAELLEQIKEVKSFQKSYASEKGRMELLKIHPDANEIEKDIRFANWFNEQETEIQSLISSGDPKKIGKAISLFKKDLGIVTKTAQDLKREASTFVNAGPTPTNLPIEQKTWYESEISKMKDKDYARLEPEIEKARREGRYVYDMTRAS